LAASAASTLFQPGDIPRRASVSTLEIAILFPTRPAGRLKRRPAGRATQQRENSFAQKPIKLHCEKASAEMSGKPLFLPNLFYQRLLRVTVLAWGST